MGDKNEVKRYTRAEVSQKDGKRNPQIWFIYKDSVYDVTTYLHEHPDGPDSILDEAGKDASKAFDEVGHTSDARTVLTKYKIGELPEEEKTYDANGKKKKKVVVPGEKNNRSCINIVTCGLIVPRVLNVSALYRSFLDSRMESCLRRICPFLKLPPHLYRPRIVQQVSDILRRRIPSSQAARRPQCGQRYQSNLIRSSEQPARKWQF